VEVSREVCRNYRNKGYCSFGANCRNSHMLPAELLALKQQADFEELTEDYGPPPPPALELVNDAAVAAFLADMNSQLYVNKGIL